MTGELGQLALCFALALSLVMAVAGLLGAREDHTAARSVAVSSAFGLFVFVALAFGTLTYAFIISDFSIMDVASNSNTLKPLVYKISGVWGITKAPCYFGCWCCRFTQRWWRVCNAAARA